MRPMILCLTLALFVGECHAQVQQPVFGSTSIGTTVSGPSFGGISIDAGGVVSTPEAIRTNSKLDKQRLRKSAQKNLTADMSRVSKLRKVSLVRLERELQKALESGTQAEIGLWYLAGLTQIEYLFADSETGDLIIAGPAEGFAPTASGAVVGIETGRPTLVLDDLLVMLRLRTMQQTLGCSFDPDKARLAKAQAWYQASPAVSTARAAKKQFQQMASVLGNYDVRVFGLPHGSHATFRMVDADYQMKRINLGLRRTGIRGFRSQLDMMRPDDNSMRRYWFAPRYDQIERSADGEVYRLSGPRLQLLSQEELTDAEGNRSKAAFTEISTQAYTKQFNKHIRKLCQRVPAFAAVQNLFDMAIVVAIIQKNGLFESADWKPTLLLDKEMLPTMEFTAPAEVPAQVNTRMAGRSAVMFQIGGGVTLVPTDVVARPGRLAADKIPELNAGSDSWWWD